MAKQNHTDGGEDSPDIGALSPLIKAYIDQHVQDAIKQHEDSPSKRKKWRNSWRSTSPITKASLILSVFVVASTVAYTIAAWRTLIVMREISSDSSLQTDKLIDAATQIKNAGWVFSGAAQGTNNAVWSAAGRLDAQAQEMRQAAASAAQTAEEALHVSERAYVVADLQDEGWSQCHLPNNDETYCSGIHYHNLGRTPAISIVVTGYMAYGWKGNNPLGALPIPAYDGLTGSSLANGPDGTSTLLRTKGDIGTEMGTKSMMQNQNGGFYLYGYIQYKDIFDEFHITAFCNYHPLNPSPQDHLPSQCGTGNWFERDPVFVKAKPNRKGD
jgi:hypothetical protein